MIPVDFDYVRPCDVPSAAALLAQASPDSVAILAGGQSLLTELKQRMRRPQLVVDLGGIGELKRIAVDGDIIRIGAMATQADIVRHPFVLERLEILAEVAAVAADPMVRGQGTLVGALCHADPSGDWVAACLVLDAVIEVRCGDVQREMTISEFVSGPGRNALQVGEMVTGLRIEAPATARLAAYRKVRHTAIGWSVAGLAASLEVDPDGRCVDCRLAASGALGRPQRLTEVEDALSGFMLKDSPGLARLIAGATGDLDFLDDRHASGAYRATRLSVLVRRTLSELSLAPA
ncbi:FAD binding domain-containing protein [Phenylobacterium sp.]|uniref:FAD binding domain-containing protein n=1 Tax=Phenylobacterium sp. TaxID=1871053 RepID=UPI003BABE79D